jgi:hypothetical protein
MDVRAGHVLQTDNPQWVLPNSCFKTSNLLKGQDEADVSDWSSICKAAATSALPACAGISKDQPLYRCSFNSLSSFYRIQQHIRAHGAVVTRCGFGLYIVLLFAYPVHQLHWFGMRHHAACCCQERN